MIYMQNVFIFPGRKSEIVPLTIERSLIIMALDSISRCQTPDQSILYML